MEFLVVDMLDVVKLADRREVVGHVRMPKALDRKCPIAPAEWCWQWVFPQENGWTNSTTKEQGRRYIEQSLVQKPFRETLLKAGLTKMATCHTNRHSFVNQLLEGGYDIRTVRP